VHSTGQIRSSVNPDEMRGILGEAGLVVLSSEVDDILKRHGALINRQRKLHKGLCFLFECGRKK
jgi:hypothetical protein